MVRGLSGAAEDIAQGFKPGQRIGNYVMEALLGSGGMGVVFRGRQLSLDRIVAIKILLKDLSKDKLFIKRFNREATVLANLNHPNIISVIDRGCEGETFFIVMEYVQGETLRDRLYREGKLAPGEVLQIGEQVLAGLAYAHRRGVVHRDIKPGNIMINREGKVKIADFGLAHLAKSQGGLDLTRDHHTVGTLKYMAPEQLTSHKTIEERVDIYSFGVCLYELITGKLPLGVFKMPTEMDSGLDVRWDEIILHSLRMDPNERFASADEMARALRELATTPQITQAERQKEEDATSKVQGVLSLTTCANCGHESAPTAHQCEECGASLEDILDECPSCKIESRLDVAQCPGCGADLAHHRRQLHREVHAIQEKARQLVSDRQFDSALLELKKLERFRTREYASLRSSARAWIERVGQRRERLFRRTYEAGERMVAEGDISRALEVWRVLPEDYEDVAARRKDLVARADEATVAVAAGNRFYDQGDVARAVAEWEKAAVSRPSDSELIRRLRVARDKLGNLNLKRSYLREASQEAARGNFDEALVLCRKALELDPSDESALLIAKEMEAKGRELTNLKQSYLREAGEEAGQGNFDEALALCRKALELDPNDESAFLITKKIEAERREATESEVREAPKDKKLPKVKSTASLSERLHLKPILVAPALLSVIALGLWFFLMHIPRTRAETAMRAERAYNDALALKEAGKPSDAITLCSQIVKDYPDTIYAEKADGLSAEMQKLNNDARARCEEAEATAGKGNLDSLIAGFKKYQEILAAPPVTLVAERKKLAEQRLEEIRNTIVRDEEKLGTQDEKNGDWHAALERYRTVAEKFGFHGNPIASKIAQVQKRLDDCAVQVQVGQKAFRASEWDVAYHAAVAALDLVPGDPDARSLLASIAPKLQPPPGMVLVPPGKYIVGGGQANPRRKAELPFGLFMDIKEVTCGRFAEFLHATGRPPPPGWTEQKGNEEMPVANVTWSEAAAFAAWAGCSLPTEEQWECACRGPSGQLYPWGDRWAPGNAVLGFGPAPVGSAKGDRSPCGCMDMAGNVAEWTATPWEPPTAASSRLGRSAIPAKSRFYIVKGSSWAGMEEERPTRVVAVPLPKGATDARILLVADSRIPEWVVRYPSNVEIEYLGAITPADYTYVLVRKWMPRWDHWGESKFRVILDQEIGTVASVIEDQGRKPRQKAVKLSLATGCFAIRQEPKEWLDLREPSGAIRRLPLASGAATRSAKLNECKDTPPAPEMTLERAASAVTRMTGRENVRYINVGFRCAKVLWPLTSPAKEPSKASAK
jgi:serine/threonine protein kinase/formylglycine-generating enzyme required for sulfatase activity